MGPSDHDPALIKLLDILDLLFELRVKMPCGFNILQIRISCICQ